MSLSGKLGFVPIDEVLRLLTRSHQQGAVVVSGSGLRGRVFVGKGGIDLATTFDDSDLHRHLVNSGLAEEGVLRRITTGETTLAAIADANQEVIELLREMTVESLYQIGRKGEEFDVQENLTTRYASPKSFELESLLADARERQREWETVLEVISDLNAPLSLRRDLGGREEVTVKDDDWKVISEIGTGASVVQIADRLGTTRFWAARAASRLVRAELVAETGAIVDETSESFAYEESPPSTYEEVFASSQPDAPAHPDVDEDEHAESWWQDPEDEDDEAEVPSAEESEPSEVEEDTEAFLEKVFSEIDSPQQDQEEGYGLLRRRRMGSMRDFSSDT